MKKFIPTSPDEEYVGYFDGSALTNPGQLGIGAVCFNAGNEKVFSVSAPVGWGTNNEAEYHAVIRLLEQALSLELKNISCYGDSQLVINQINRVWAVNKDELKELHTRVMELVAQFEKTTFTWIRREKNELADQLSKRAHEIDVPEVILLKKEPIKAQNVVQLHTAQLALPQVRKIARNKLLIIESDQSNILSLDTEVCSCGAFIRTNKCRHLEILHTLKGSVNRSKAVR